MLRFENLGESAVLASMDAYEYEWFVFDLSGGATPRGVGIDREIESQ